MTVTQEERVHGSVLMQCASTLSPLDEVSVQIDRQVAESQV